MILCCKKFRMEGCMPEKEKTAKNDIKDIDGARLDRFRKNITLYAKETVAMQRAPEGSLSIEDFIRLEGRLGRELFPFAPSLSTVLSLADEINFFNRILFDLEANLGECIQDAKEDKLTNEQCIRFLQFIDSLNEKLSRLPRKIEV